MTVADVKGELDIDVLVEDLTGDIVKQELIDIFTDRELEGEIIINGKKYSI